MQKYLSDSARGTAQKGVYLRTLNVVPIATAPLGEQTRIADKLDTTLTRVDACRDRLARVAPLIKRFRQAVLAAATSGRLTEGWRVAKLSELPSGDIPLAWTSTTVRAITADLRYGTSKKCDYSPVGIGVLRIPNISDGGRIDCGDLKRAIFSENEISKLKLEVGDLLIIRSNGSADLVGKASVVTEAEKGLLFAGYLMRLRVITDIAVPAFVLVCLAAPGMRQSIELASKSTSGVNNINTQELQDLPLQIPPLEEQLEIVRRVESLFAYADRLEARLKTAQAAAERLTPALLAKAFRGELVPQDPADEPAGELLKRLASTPKSPGGSGRRLKTQPV